MPTDCSPHPFADLPATRPEAAGAPQPLSWWEKVLFLVAAGQLLAFTIALMATEDIRFSVLVGATGAVSVGVPFMAMRWPGRAALVVVSLFVGSIVLVALSS